jgi:hypothetical protein
MSLTNKTQQFNFNFDSISLGDLLLLYNHFQIEKFGNFYDAKTKEEFFKCFDEEGNSNAKKLIYLAALYAHGAINMLDKKIISNEKEYNFYEIWHNKTIEFELDETDYEGLNTEGYGVIDIIDTYFYYEIEVVKSILVKYNFLIDIQSL